MCPNGRFHFELSCLVGYRRGVLSFVESTVRQKASPQPSVTPGHLRSEDSKTPGFLEQSRCFTTLACSLSGGFRVNASVHRQLNRRKRRILRRIENKPGVERPEPMMTASNLHYEMSEKVRGIAPGGIGAIHLLARKIG